MMRAHEAAARPAGGAGWCERLALLVLVAATLGFYAYLANSRVAQPWAFHAGAVDYYHLQSDGFLAGQLAMTVKPDPELATLPDPYDPPSRLRIGHPGLADASYYGGKYYLYFGAAPILTLFLPFKLLTGVQISESWACALFCGLGFVACLAIFLDLRRRFFPGVSAGVTCLGALLLGSGNLCAMMLTRSQFYEVPIAGAYGFSSLAMLALVRALAGGRRRRTWLGAASVAFGLAVASRPHFLLASPVLGLVWLWLRRDQSLRRTAPTARAGGLADAIALILPVAAIVVSMLVYNQLRFHSPLEFGQRFQLGGSNVGKMTLLTGRSIPVNLYYYFWAPAQWERYFPFVDPVRPYPGVTPSSYYGVEDPFGVLANLPCFWLLAAVLPLWWSRWRSQRDLGRLLGLFFAVFAPICLFILVFVSATNRYAVDFLPALLLLAMVGLLMLGELPLRRVARGLRAVVLGAVTMASVFFSAMAAFQHNGLFQHHQPAAFDRLGRWFNLPTAGWERLAGQRYGPVQATIQLSRSSVGANEPLVVSGTGVRSDFIYIYYTGPDSIQIGSTHAGDADNFLSRPIPLDYGVPHVFGIDAGSLYPPASHPFFRGSTPAQVHEKKSRLRVTIDGVPYVDLERKFYDASPALVSVGLNHVSDYAGKALKGRVLAMRREALPPAIAPFAGGSAVELAFVPGAAVAGRKEPLVATGGTGKGDLLFAIYDDATHLRLGFHHAGTEPILSDPIEFDPAQVLRLRVSLGSFYPAPRDANERELARALSVTCNDRLVWLEPSPFYPAGGKPPVLGANSWNSDQVTAPFSGRIVAVQAVPPPSLQTAAEPFAFHTYWLRSDGPGYGPLRLHVEFPRDQAGKFEPLLVTGPSVSRADYLWIQYVDAARATIGYEHTGGGGPRALVPVAMAEPHVLEIELPSLYPPAGDAFFHGRSPIEVAALKNHARIAVDGAVQIDARVKAYESTPAQSTPGENRLSATFGKAFSGAIRGTERGTFAPPPGFSTETGPLELVLDLPEKRPENRTELLLATGADAAVDTLSLIYGAGGELLLEIRDHGGATHRSPALRLAAAGEGQVLRVTWGGFNGAGRAGAAEAAAVKISFNGQPALEATLDFARANPQSVWIGGGLGSGAGFSGVIRSVQRLPENAR